MDKIKSILISIAIILILLAASFFSGYQLHKYTYKIDIKDSSNVVTIIDTNWHHDSIPFPVPYMVIDTVPIPQFVDTTAILKEYYKEKYYSFPLQFGDISFKITQNSLFDYKANIFTTTVTKYVYPKYSIGIGGNIGIIYNNPFVEIDGVYIHKNNAFNVAFSYPVGIKVGYKYMFHKF